MNANLPKEEDLLVQIRSLVALHARTRLWFWRTSVAALVAAGIWIIGFALLPSSADLDRQIALTAGSFPMWILFFVAFRMQKRLNDIVKQVQILEQALVDSKRA